MIDDAGGWQHDTLTEDLDLSYRAQRITEMRLQAGDGAASFVSRHIPSAAPVTVHVRDGNPALEIVRAAQEFGRMGVPMEGPITHAWIPAQSVYFTDPDGLLVQLQDVKYCGGGGVLGDMCS